MNLWVIESFFSLSNNRKLEICNAKRELARELLKQELAV